MLLDGPEVDLLNTKGAKNARDFINQLCIFLRLLR